MARNVARGLGTYKHLGLEIYEDDKIEVYYYSGNYMSTSIKIHLLDEDGDRKQRVYDYYGGTIYEYHKGKWIDYLAKLNKKGVKLLKEKHKSRFTPLSPKDEDMFNA